MDRTIQFLNKGTLYYNFVRIGEMKMPAGMSLQSGAKIIETTK